MQAIGRVACDALLHHRLGLLLSALLVRETQHHVRHEINLRMRAAADTLLSHREIFVRTTLTDRTLSSQEALEWGVVAEVLPREALDGGAWEIARQLARKPDLLLRYSRIVLTQPLRDGMLENVQYHLALEGRVYYEPSNEGLEAKIGERLDRLRRQRREARKGDNG